MEHLIDKDAVVTEIKSYISNYKEIVAKTNRDDSTWVDSVSMIDAKIDVLHHLLSFIGTLEVKEVDEVKIGETQIYLEDDGGEPPYDGKQWLDLSCTEYEIPKALFEDGDNVEILIRKAQKGE